MATITVKYLKFRDGRPRWEPGPTLRAKGIKGRDLKDEAGRWLGLEAAIAAANALNAEIHAWRLTGRRRPPVPRKVVARTVRHLSDDWQKSVKFTKRGANTQRDYLSKASLFLAEFGDAPVAAIEKAHLYRWWQELHGERGHAMANGVLAVARVMLSHATRIGWRADNPAMKLGLETVAPRVVVWTPAEIAAFVGAADRLGQHAIADAVIIALHTGQRQGDVLALEHAATTNGRVMFRQGKTGARVSVPLTPALEQRLDEIRARRAAGAVVELHARQVVLDDQGRDYTGSRYNKAFVQVRDAAAAEAGPQIAGRLFLDLRDTAVTRLALAGCTIAEIRAITGHTLQTIHSVLQHYLALDDRMADAGIDRLKVWLADEGIAI